MGINIVYYIATTAMAGKGEKGVIEYLGMLSIYAYTSAATNPSVFITVYEYTYSSMSEVRR